MSGVTLAEVAALAGVSTKSVSRVVNGEPNVRPSLRTRVQAAIEELGYVPNLAARSLAASRAFAIGVLFDNPSPNYTMKVQEGAYGACRARGYQLVIEHVDTKAVDLAGAMRALVAHSRLDGMLLTPPATECDAILAALEEIGMPYVRLAPVSFDGRSSAVGIDDAAAAGDLARHLWDLGHRRFGLINGPPAHGAARTRREGFLRTLQGLQAGAPNVRQAQGEFTFRSGIAAGLQLLDGPDRPTAVFTANDDMAAGLYTAAGQLGLRVPADLSVVGFDDSWIAQNIWPELTTIHQPISEMAARAVEVLLDKRGEENATLLLDYALVVRESTAAPPIPKTGAAGRP